MTERIYTRDQQGQLEPLEEEHFAKEEELQALIAEHPEVLDGEQMRPGAPLRWILIAREQGIAESSDAAARWAVDHLLVDQDAVPTLVEVKRGSNPEIRRTIVGQMLEYAAHAARTWTADTLRHAFEESVDARGLDPSEELGKLLAPDGEEEPDADGFWERVATNLAAARLRLLFVADDIPDPLERVVEFLNAQMARIEVLAVEIKQFKGDSRQTLVPRVIGRTAASPARAHHANHLSEEKFYELLGDSTGSDTAQRYQAFVKGLVTTHETLAVTCTSKRLQIRVQPPERGLFTALSVTTTGHVRTSKGWVDFLKENHPTALDPFLDGLSSIDPRLRPLKKARVFWVPKAESTTCDLASIKPKLDELAQVVGKAVEAAEAAPLTPEIS